VAQTEIALHLEEIDLFDNLGLGVSHPADSTAFFLQALQPLGVTLVVEGPYGVGQCTCSAP
jgi:hypothetical protein